MSSGSPLLFLSDADIGALDLDVNSVRLAVHKAFELYSKNAVRCAPKTSLAIVPGHAFQSLVAVDTERNYAALKWVGMVPPGGAAKININASLLLSAVDTGQVCCLMDARRATALRTAGMSAVAAQYLARKDCTSIGFVGAGVQAASHLSALAELLPGLRRVYVNSLPAATAERFAERSRQLGFETTICTTEETVSQGDIVVTTVPLVPDFKPFVNASWIRPGALVIAVDLGRSWVHTGLSGVDVTVVDEEAMKHSAKPGNYIPPLEHAEATLADLAGGLHRGRTGADQRIMLFSSGSAVADLAISMLIYETATAQGIGTRLEL